MKNIIQISIDNFQSIKHADLVFEQGINVIVGQSNSGKSATLRALKSLVLNPRKSQKFIKSGESSFSVSVDYLGNSIKFVRGQKESKYIINGEEYQKVGNSNLSKILDKSGFVLDSNDKLMNLESELELPFPFDKGPQDLFKLFEKSIFCVSDSALVLKTIKADEDAVKKDKSETEYELNRFNKKLKALNDLEQEVNIDKLKEGKIKLEEAFFEIEKFRENYNKVSEAIRAGKELKNFKAEIQQPDLTAYFKLASDVETVNTLLEKIKVLKTSKPEIASNLTAEEYSKLNKDYKKLLNIKEAFLKIKETREEVKTSVDIEKYLKIKKDYTTVLQTLTRCQELKYTLEENGRLKDSLKGSLSKFVVCPLCGQKIMENTTNE